MEASLLAQIDLPSLGREGPDDLRSLLSTSFLLLAVGFAIGVVGHLTQIRMLVIAGIAIVFAGTAFFVIAIGQYG